MGELCNLNDLYGHVEYENDGLVPLLLITIAESIYTSYPSVKYYAYGTYFGARAPMRRFKRKFEFHPYRVFWELQTPADKPLPYFYIYRKLMVREQSNMPLAGGSFVMAARWSDLSRVFPLWRRKAGLYAALKWTLKILSGTRVFFGVVAGENLATYGWAHLGWCRHYSIEPDAVVLGRTLTSEAYRGKGLASGALVRIMNVLFRQGYRLFYIDTKTHNLPAQRMIAKAGFTHRIDG
jgi:RimJ/RimL family protein N-acetyltransferase